jgi:heparan-alpha-glucosaminide N-acetyltransferase
MYLQTKYEDKIMKNTERIVSIDIMRGLTLVLMLFVNDLYMPGVPSWLGHMPATFDGMGLADWVFPGFLFMVGMAIPFSIGKRISKGESNVVISKHILIRTVSLLLIGILMLNSERVNAGLTGIGKNLWAILMYTGVFLVWNKYPDRAEKFSLFTGLRLLGAALLIVLVSVFRSGETGNRAWLVTEWWGILGLIGWGYLVSAFVYLAARDNIIYTLIAVLFFLALNILSGLGLMNLTGTVGSIAGIIIQGNVPLIVLTGLLTILIMKKLSGESEAKALAVISAVGLLSVAAGFFLRKWFIISKIEATPSWGLICNGISMMLFCLIYWIADIRKRTGWAFILKPAGENSLTTYLAPDILYFIIWSTSMPILIYKQSAMPLVVIAGSLLWAFLMVGLTSLLVRFNIKLRL